MTRCSTIKQEAHFLTTLNINYAMFDTFGVIDGTTSGGPAAATNTLVCCRTRRHSAS